MYSKVYTFNESNNLFDFYTTSTQMYFVLTLKIKAKKFSTFFSASLGTATLGRGKNTSASKRREVCDSELKDILSNMISQVRVPHVLPRDRSSEVLDMALQRNLFPVLPNFTSQVNESTKYSPWDPKSNNGLFVRPRLFLPYFEECKKLIQDRCAQDPEIIASNSPCVSVPDTLYMLRTGNKLDGFHGGGSDEDLIEFQTSRVPGRKFFCHFRG